MWKLWLDREHDRQRGQREHFPLCQMRDEGGQMMPCGYGLMQVIMDEKMDELKEKREEEEE